MDRIRGREAILDHKTERAGGDIEKLGVGGAVKAKSEESLGGCCDGNR